MRDLSISVHFARAVLKNTVAQGLDPISLLVSAVGEPYWGKPDVRFDEGDQRTESR